jgi:hypothetical protein
MISCYTAGLIAGGGLTVVGLFLGKALLLIWRQP